MIEHLDARPPEKHRERLEQQERGELVYFVAWAGDRAVGTGLLRWRGRVGYPQLEDLWVQPARRNDGIGSAILEAVEHAAADGGEDGRAYPLVPPRRPDPEVLELGVADAAAPAQHSRAHRALAVPRDEVDEVAPLLLLEPLAVLGGRPRVEVLDHCLELVRLERPDAQRMRRRSVSAPRLSSSSLRFPHFGD